ncbi:hypothetical protein [Nostoc sp. WHI]|uniref:hypothetical protein n=1 Tax=Nostoc sp. WHI TaxID=2650611 RepID=UPI0018C77313|nr:hypothetical protein [Nostoc sp. WHI]MBG1270715.1 hypothetical protein [Nostoc sp. WHI]
MTVENPTLSRKAGGRGQFLLEENCPLPPASFNEVVVGLRLFTPTCDFFYLRFTGDRVLWLIFQTL